MGHMTAITILPALETPHLVLREMDRNDGRELASYMTQPRYQRYITHRLKDDTEVQAFVRRNIIAQRDKRRRIFHLVAEEHMSGEVVGDAFIISHGDGVFEIGWGVHPALWRMGFGTEIGRAILALGFERLKAKRVFCKVMVANEASACLARRIGLKMFQAHPDYAVGAGRTEAVDVFSLSADDYYDLPY